MGMSGDSSGARPVTFRQVLRHPNFLRLWLAQAVSFLGDRLTEVAVGVFALEVSGESALAVAWVLAFRLVPLVVFGFGAAAVVDRVDKRKTMILCDVARAIMIGCARFVRTAQPIYLITLMMSSFTTFYTPAVLASVPETLEKKEEIIVASSLSYSTKFFTDILGYSLAATIVRLIGPRMAFSLDSLTFLVSALLISRMTVLLGPAKRGGNLVAESMRELREGLRYQLENRVALSLVLLSAIMAPAVGATNTLLLVAVPKLLGVPKAYWGYLLAAQGIGMFGTTLAIGRWGQRVRRSRMILGSLFMTGSIVVLIAFNRSFAWALLFYLLFGVSNAGYLVPTIAWLQESVPVELRGRVMTFRYMIVYFNMAIGAVVAGMLADALGLSSVLAVCGLLLIGTAMVGLRLWGLRRDFFAMERLEAVEASRMQESTRPGRSTN